MPQIEELKPPKNPAKLTDTRAQDYISQHGYSSWELDALNPEVLMDLIRGKISDLIDFEKYEAMGTKEEEQRKYLKTLSEQAELDYEEKEDE